MRGSARGRWANRYQIIESTKPAQSDYLIRRETCRIARVESLENLANLLESLAENNAVASHSSNADLPNANVYMVAKQSDAVLVNK